MTPRYRVLWIDAAGEGRFTDLDAESSAEAAWHVCQQAESTQAQLVDVILLRDRRAADDL